MFKPQILSLMYTSKHILVVTTPTVEGRPVKRYLKPVTAHIVAGTNVFSDVVAAFTDVFGGRSQTYQSQLASLHDEAIEKIKAAAYELGANCVVGLTIDMDEISGKGKSMFMLTALGTAVIIEEKAADPIMQTGLEKFANVSIDRINALHKKNEIIKQAAENKLELNDATWDFITTNQVEQVFTFILQKYKVMLGNGTAESDKSFYLRMLKYLEAFSEEQRSALLYDAMLKEDNELLYGVLANIIKDLKLLDLNYVKQLLEHTDFTKRKKGFQMLIYDKPFFNKQDITQIEMLKAYAQASFKERGTRTTKKQLLSSKEKEVWVCDCGRTNDLNQSEPYCDGCAKDIYGFNKSEMPFEKAIRNIDYKVNLIRQMID
jgi:uncharacterized protein YbjQ (UPF0145 family)/CDGSH-type Zn-finger protein